MLAAIAILICNVPVLLQFCGWLALGAECVRQWRIASQTRTLYHHGGKQDTTNAWMLDTTHQDLVQGTLVKGGYRSAGLLLLVLHDSEKQCLKRIPVWRDSVSDLHYSYLNLQLMFNAGKQR